MTVPYPPGPIVGEPGPLGQSPRRVSAAGYWIGGIGMFVGVALVLVVSVIGIFRAAEVFKFPQVVDSTGGIWIDEPGGKVIFSVRDGRPSTRPVWTSIVSVTGPDGATVPTVLYTGSRTVTSSDSNTGFVREADAVATFKATKSGRYVLSAQGLETGSTLGIGDGVDTNVAGLVLAGLGAGLMILAGLVLLIVTAVRRSRQRHGGQAPPPGGYPTGPYPYGGYWYPGQTVPYGPAGAAPAPVSSSPGSPYPPPPPPGWVSGPPSNAPLERDTWGRPSTS